ncbi:MAG: hypothetical protein JO099_16280 [Acidobacteriia bacterium]|nr:hypothetical protein [Terriglobia bacterium]
MKLLIRVIVSVVIAAAGMAQMPPPKGVRTIDFYRVKRDRIEDFQAAVKDYNVALKKAGGPIGYTMFVALSGPAEYIRIMVTRIGRRWTAVRFPLPSIPGRRRRLPWPIGGFATRTMERGEW